MGHDFLYEREKFGKYFSLRLFKSFYETHTTGAIARHGRDSINLQTIWTRSHLDNLVLQWLCHPSLYFVDRSRSSSCWLSSCPTTTTSASRLELPRPPHLQRVFSFPARRSPARKTWASFMGPRIRRPPPLPPRAPPLFRELWSRPPRPLRSSGRIH